LRGRDIGRLVIVGMMTHMCIDTPTRAAADLGFECVLVHDACATRDLSFGGRMVPAATVQGAFMAALDGLFAKVESAPEACTRLHDSVERAAPLR
jgi:nicotinamidase-related amidase